MAVRELLGIAVPTALGNLCEYLPVAVGMAIVGRREGADALAAVALARAYFNVTAMAVGFGLVSALRTLCPQAVGAGRPELCATYAQRASLLVVAGGVPCCALQLVSGRALRAFGQPAHLAALARPYCLRLMGTYFGVNLMTVLQRVYQAHGLVWQNLAVTAAVCASAPPLQLALVGAVGALALAWATSLYNALYVLLQVAHLCGRRRGRGGNMAYLFAPRPLRSELLAPRPLRVYHPLAQPRLAQSLLEWSVGEVAFLLAGRLRSASPRSARAHREQPAGRLPHGLDRPARRRERRRRRARRAAAAPRADAASRARPSARRGRRHAPRPRSGGGRARAARRALRRTPPRRAPRAARCSRSRAWCSSTRRTTARRAR